MALLLWMLVCGVLILLAADRLAPPALDRRLQLLLLALALLPVAPSLRPGLVLRPAGHQRAAPAVGHGRRRGLSPRRAARSTTSRSNWCPGRPRRGGRCSPAICRCLNPYSGAGEALLGNGQAAPFSLVSLLSLPIQAAAGAGRCGLF